VLLRTSAGRFTVGGHPCQSVLVSLVRWFGTHAGARRDPCGDVPMMLCSRQQTRKYIAIFPGRGKLIPSMPRVIFTVYLARRNELIWAWENYQACFTQLHFNEQRYLHDYFRFTEALAESELRDYWQTIHAQQSSLPKCAGRAFAALRHTHVYATARQHVGLAGKPSNATLHIRGLARPQPDLEKLAKVLLEIARGIDV